MLSVLAQVTPTLSPDQSSQAFFMFELLAVITVFTAIASNLANVYKALRSEPRTPLNPETFASKKELRDLETALATRITEQQEALETRITEQQDKIFDKLDAIQSSVNHAFHDIHRALGKLEGR